MTGGWSGVAAASGTGQAWPMSAVLAIGCLFLAMFLVGALLVGMLRPDDRARKLAARIERYGSRHAAARSERAAARLANRLMSPVLRIGSIEENLALRLDLA